MWHISEVSACHLVYIAVGDGKSEVHCSFLLFGVLQLLDFENEVEDAT